ncbi:MAG: hypothetical protein AB7S44_02140 [Spirochaetales bacterium]
MAEAVQDEKIEIGKKPLLILLIILFVIGSSIGAYFLTYNYLIPREVVLSAPINLAMLEDNSTLAWDETENAENYTVEVLNRTSDSLYYLFVTVNMFTINTELGRVEFDISSYITTDSNYSFKVKANSLTFQNSIYSAAYEFQQVDPSADENPYVAE